MKKLILIILSILVLSAAPGCSAPPVQEDGTVPKPPSQGNEIEDKSASILSSMTVEEKIGQLLVVGFPQDASEEVLRDYIDRFKVSGFILFKRNYTDFDSQYNLVKSLKEMNSRKNLLPLFISIDEEGGTVSRLPAGGTHFPDARKVGKAGDPVLTYKTGMVIGQELRASGININFAPVLDIVSDSRNKLLIRRSYGSNAEAVSLHGISFIKGLQSSGVIAVPKHFPGHGSTIVDSHSQLPVVDIDKETLWSRDLVPFKDAVMEGADAVMVGHLAFPRLDPSGLPATMSRYFLTDVLRNELGFEGIAISDDIEMSGYSGGKLSLEESVITSFNAGLDVFLIGSSPEIQERVFTALRDACADGRITEERLNESVLRIIKVKLKHRLSDAMEYSLEEARSIFGSEEHKAVLEEVNKLSN